MRSQGAVQLGSGDAVGQEPARGPQEPSGAVGLGGAVVRVGDEIIDGTPAVEEIRRRWHQAEGEILAQKFFSLEEQQEALDNGAEQVINIVHSFRLQATSFDKKSYLTYLKGYMKTIKQSLQETNPDRVPEFEKKAAEFAKKVVGKFNDWEFYTGESMNPDGMVALLNYREDGVTPYFVFWKDGLKEEKI